MALDQREAEYQDEDMEFEKVLWYYRTEGASEKAIKNLHSTSDMILVKLKMLHAEPLVRDV